MQEEVGRSKKRRKQGLRRTNSRKKRDKPPVKWQCPTVWHQVLPFMLGLFVWKPVDDQLCKCQKYPKHLMRPGKESWRVEINEVEGSTEYQEMSTTICGEFVFQERLSPSRCLWRFWCLLSTRPKRTAHNYCWIFKLSTTFPSFNYFHFFRVCFISTNFE